MARRGGMSVSEALRKVSNKELIMMEQVAAVFVHPRKSLGEGCRRRVTTLPVIPGGLRAAEQILTKKRLLRRSGITSPVCTNPDVHSKPVSLRWKSASSASALI